MKIIAGIVIFMFACFRLSAQTVTVLADNPDDGCRIKLEKIRSGMEARRKKYEFNVQEYREGLFCSECGRTKSEIEERARMSFSQHIQDGSAHNRRALVASRELYNKLYTEYITDFNRLKAGYDEQYNDCGGDAASLALQIITDQQLLLYKTELGGYIDMDRFTWREPGKEYDFYYAWMLKIRVTTWRTFSFRAVGDEKINTRGVDNDIERAGSLLNNYVQSLTEKHPMVFRSGNAQSIRQFQGLFSREH
ncbi:hypothetical protein [Mucilaginibacter dorajii]|uniref:Uncharacterized protein n=1 Tax=Mucilaginibacter dorajii TaxID=692994 RepID=A0ABP7R4E4_9SPHI|nr:hypothetical protein [Mucilaginibacter dorajii]MCS3737820.1 hypothetical protein [Mucilaginibacter dorajii]